MFRNRKQITKLTRLCYGGKISRLKMEGTQALALDHVSSSTSLGLFVLAMQALMSLMSEMQLVKLVG